MNIWDTDFGQPPDLRRLIGKKLEWCGMLESGPTFLALFDTHLLMVEPIGIVNGKECLKFEIGDRKPGATFDDVKAEVRQDPHMVELRGMTFDGIDGSVFSFGRFGVDITKHRGIQFVKKAH